MSRVLSLSAALAALLQGVVSAPTSSKLWFGGGLTILSQNLLDGMLLVDVDYE
jgi:hypothetical protein